MFTYNDILDAHAPENPPFLNTQFNSACAVVAFYLKIINPIKIEVCITCFFILSYFSLMHESQSVLTLFS